jgi:putative intracellular protease/amidase
MTDINNIAIVGYDKCSEQDTITPLEIFKGTAMVLSGQINPWPLSTPQRDLSVKLVNLDNGNITMQMGTQVVPDATLGDNDLFDLLYVPGGIGSGAMTKDDRMLDLIRRHHSEGKVIASNCSGIGILFRSGILGREPVTCQAAVERGLRADGANVPNPRHMWLGLPDARLWTTTGSYGVDGSTVALVSHYFGHEVGTVVAMMFDTMGGLGDQIYSTTGPEFFFRPDLEAKFQDFFQPVLLPEEKQ